MKRIIAALLAAVFLLSGCGAEYGAERAAKKMLNALQDGNLSKAAKYTREGSLRLTGSGSRAKKIYQAMFGTIRYVVAGVTAEDGAAEVIVKVTMVDMETIASDVSLDLLEYTLNGGWNADKALYNSMLKLITSEDAEHVTNTATAYLVKTDGGWKIDMEQSTKFVEAVTGGLGILNGE